MILTVTPNAAVDRTYRVERFMLDRVNRPSQSFTVAGGKGINVARVYQTLGGKAIATGFLGGVNGLTVSGAMAAERIESDFVEVEGESRVCIAIIDPTTGTQTEVNESGPTVSPCETRHLLDKVHRLIANNRFEFLALCGSLPPGAPAELYAELISIARNSRLRTVLDTSGEALRLGVQARPWMVKPNRAELESLLATEIEDENSLVRAAEHLLESGTELVVLTRGSEGAIAAIKGTILAATPPVIEFASAVASGDSFVAALLWSLKDGKALAAESLHEALRLATGAGAANAAVIGAGFCSLEAIEAEASRSIVRRVA